jgi:hypothetical protein
MTKISALSDIGTSVASNDTFVLVDVSDPTTPNKKIQQQNILAAGGLLPDGSVGTPGLRFLNDTNVGLYRPTTDALAFVTAGENRLHITSAGLVGIGTSSPGAQTDSRITGGGAAPATSGTSQPNAAFRVSGTGTTGVLDIGCNGPAPWIQSTDRADLSQKYDLLLNPNGGRVGIGTTSPASLLTSYAGNVSTLGAKASTGLLIENNGSVGNVSQIGLGYTFSSTNHPIAIAAVTTSGAGSTRADLVFATRDLTTDVAPTERARIDSSGRLLVGTATAPTVGVPASATFVVQGYAGVPTGDSLISLQRGQAPASISSGAQLGAITFGANDGSPYAQIHAATDGAGGTNDYPGRLVFSTTADGGSSPTERVRINAAGAFKASLAGTYDNATSPYHELRTNTSGDWIAYFTQTTASNPNGVVIKYSAAAPNSPGSTFLYCEDTVGIKASIRSNGGIANFSANDVNLSDINSKKDISPAVGTWDCIKEWEIVNYRYKDQPDDADLNLGVIAQQVAESCPEVITVFEEAKEATEDAPAQEQRLGVKEQQMYWMAIKALQEAQVRIEQLESKVAALESA